MANESPSSKSVPLDTTPSGSESQVDPTPATDPQVDVESASVWDLRTQFVHCLNHPENHGGSDKLLAILAKENQGKTFWKIDNGLKTFALRHPLVFVQTLGTFKDEPWAYELTLEVLDSPRWGTNESNRVKTLIQTHCDASWLGDFLIHFEGLFASKFSYHLFGLAKLFGQKPWAPGAMAKAAEARPEFALDNAFLYVDLPEAEAWAETAVRVAAKLRPELALVYSKHFWHKPWGPDVVKEALGNAQLTRFENLDDLNGQPWLDQVGFHWIVKK